LSNCRFPSLERKAIVRDQLKLMAADGGWLVYACVSRSTAIGGHQFVVPFLQLVSLCRRHRVDVNTTPEGSWA